MSEAPEYYKGVKVPQARKRYWDKPTMRAWREGVDSTLNMLLFAAKKAEKTLQKNAPTFFISDWAEGAQYGREDAQEMVILQIANLINSGDD